MTISPFRSDARERVRVDVLNGEPAYRAITTYERAEMKPWHYLLVLAVGPVATTWRTGNPIALGASLVFALVAWVMWRAKRQQAAQYQTMGAQTSPGWLTHEGILVAGDGARRRWSWSAVRAVVEQDDVILVHLGHVALALAKDAHSARALTWLSERVRPQAFRRPGRLLALTSVVYLLCVAAGLVILPAYLPF